MDEFEEFVWVYSEESRPFAPSLPLEIFNIIFSYIEDDCSIHEWCMYSLVSRNWYAAVTPRLYHTFKNNGDMKDRERLWQFMRTVVEAPALAKHVKEVNLLHCLKYTGPESVTLAQRLCSEYIPVLYHGMREAAINYYEPEPTLEALREDDRRPIVAMILACLDNLETLYMHVAYDDIYFRAVAENAPCAVSSYPAGCGRYIHAFKKLKRLFLNTNEQPDANLPLQVDRYQPLIYFPQLQELCLLNVNFSDFVSSWTVGGGRTGISPNLTKMTVELFHGCPLEDFLNFLDNVPPLTELRVNFQGTPPREWTIHGQVALWNRLIRFKTTLETLDIYHLETEVNQPEIEFCPPVDEFFKLKSLSISPAVLRGNCKRHDKPFQLMQHVPRGLEFLGLYHEPDMTRTHSRYIPTWDLLDLESQLEKLAMGREPKVIHAQLVGKRHVGLPVGKMMLACRQQGIEYSRELMTRGGPGTEFGQSSFRHERRENLKLRETLIGIKNKAWSLKRTDLTDRSQQSSGS